LLQEPDLLTLEVFSDIGHRQILAAMLAVAATGEIPEAAGMSGRLEEAGLNDLLAELALSNAPWVDLAEIRKLLERLQSLHNEEKRRELALLLENEKEESERQRLQAEIHALARERSRKVGRRVVGE